jgi:polysaccharide deacetylase family protein (PEP-CTERM system associated)
MKNILSIDIEDYCHSRITPGSGDFFDGARVSRAIDEALVLFSRYDAKATFFVLGVIAEKIPQSIRKISDAGYEVASHGYLHRPIYTLSQKEFSDDLLRSAQVLESITGKRPEGYRAPYWSITNKSLWAIDIIKENGFLYDSSISPAVNFLYGIKGARRSIYQHPNGLWEIPPTTLNVLFKLIIIGGGLYLRAMPYWLTKKCFVSFNKKKIPAMVYLHPHELINYHSVQKLPFGEWLILNFHKKTFKRKIDSLLNDFQLTSLKGILNKEG